MPATNPADHQARSSIFYNRISSRQDAAPNGRQLREMIGISNTPHQLGSGIPAAQAREEVYPSLSIPVSPDDMGETGSRVATGGIGSAIKRHPLAATFVVGVTVFTTIACVANLSPDSSRSAASWPDGLPKPQSLNVGGGVSFASNPTVFGVCQQAIENFPPSSGTQADLPSLRALRLIKSDAEDVRRMAQSMVQDHAMTSTDLQRAARCTGVRLLRDKVEAMTADLQAMRRQLGEGTGADSIDAAAGNIIAQQQDAEIGQRLEVLGVINHCLTQATIVINERLLQMAG